MKSSKPSNWKICATCTHWCGKQIPNIFLTHVEYESTERARCAGGGFDRCDRPADSTCPKWEQRFKR